MYANVVISSPRAASPSNIVFRSNVNLNFFENFIK